MAQAPFTNIIRVYRKRALGLPDQSINAVINGTPGRLLGEAGPASVTAGTGTAQIVLKAGQWLAGTVAGNNMTLTITSGAGLAVTSNGLDIAVVTNGGASTATAVVAAINAAFNASFVVATVGPGAGAGNVATLAKKNFVSDQRVP